MSKTDERDLMVLYKRLFDAYGAQNWWPADTPFEVMVGAVLTQNTAWTNVDKAIVQIKKAGKMDLIPMHRMTERRLAKLVRPSGYFNIKAKRLKALCSWLIENKGIDALKSWPTGDLRDGFLGINGVGPETADDILLYAFQRPVFVIDTYTRRLLGALDLIEGREPYETLRYFFESNLPKDAQLFNEYHALIVRHAKEKCRFDDTCLHCVVEKPL